MFKAQGSIILPVPSITVAAHNGVGVGAQFAGKVTGVHNMAPGLFTPTIAGNAVVGETTNDPILTGPSVFDSLTNHPNIGELQVGSAPEGILLPTFWNSFALGPASSERLDYFQIPGGSPINPFNGWDQIFLRNNTSQTLVGVFLDTGSGPVLIPTSTPGELGPNEIFTTTVPAAASVIFNVPLTFTGPTDTTVNCGDNATFSVSVTASDGVVTYQWQEDSGSGFVNLPGETAPTLTLPSVTGSMTGNQYRCIVQDNTDTVTSAVATLTVNDIAFISTQPVGGQFYTGDPLTLSVALSCGTGVFNYTWKLNGTPIAGAPNAPVYSDPSLSLAEAGSYTVAWQEVGGLGSSGESNPAVVQVQDPVNASNITGAGTENVGNPWTFTVIPTGGYAPLSYQWQFDGGSGFTNLVDGGTISGANTPVLTISALTLANAGDYRCIVSDSLTSSDTSPSVTLVVTDNIFCNLGPNLNVYTTDTVTIAATWTGGNGNFGFAWERDTGSGFTPISDGGNISGATTSTLTITNPALTDAGTYRLTISDDSGINQPGVCTMNLAVYSPLTVTVAPTVVNAYYGTPITLTATISGGVPPFTHDWRQNGSSIGAPDQPTYNFTAAAGLDGLYDVQVTDSGSDISGPTTVLSNAAQVNLGPPLVALGINPSLVRTYKDDPTFTLVALDTGGLGTKLYSWFLIIPPLPAIPVASNLPFPVLPVDPSDPGVPIFEGFIYFTVTDAVSTQTSANIPVEVDNHLAIAGNGIEDSTATNGQNFSFTINTTGGLGALSYQWFKDDGSKVFQPIPGETSDTLAFSPATFADAGLYQVEVSDQGSTISHTNDTVNDTATLTVQSGIPAANVLGLVFLSVMTAIAGAFMLRRRTA
jgi:hypothetical protein